MGQEHEFASIDTLYALAGRPYADTSRAFGPTPIVSGPFLAPTVAFSLFSMSMFAIALGIAMRSPGAAMLRDFYGLPPVD